MTDDDKTCFECDGGSTHAFHVVPQALGGTQTVELCPRCRDLAKNGGRVTSGRTLVGFRILDGQLAACSHEQNVIQVTRELDGQGLSLREIAGELEAMALWPRTNGNWGHKQDREPGKWSISCLSSILARFQPPRAPTAPRRNGKTKIGRKYSQGVESACAYELRMIDECVKLDREGQAAGEIRKLLHTKEIWPRRRNGRWVAEKFRQRGYWPRTTIRQVIRRANEKGQP